LGSALTALLHDPAWIDALGRQGRARTVRTANWDQVAGRVHQTLREVASL
jgi:phosphatidylinositol alpha-1,6-mannosyltransferase